jgi:hypothetical protein
MSARSGGKYKDTAITPLECASVVLKALFGASTPQSLDVVG